MSFNSIVLIVASIIFVLLLGLFSYFIYVAQQRKYNIVPASCPDYWSISSVVDKNGKVTSSSCNPPAEQTNWGKCTEKKPPTPYSQPLKLTKPCDIFLDKYAWTRSNCGGTILWDGVTNNDDYRRSCKPAPTS
jgi:hypothetical protein